MKRYFTILAALGLAHAVAAQQSGGQSGSQSASTFQPRTPAASALQSPGVQSIYQSEFWQRRFAGYYGVDTEVSPEPQPADIQQIQQVRELLQDPQTMEAAAQALNQYRTNAEEGAYSPLIDQVVGSIYFQLGNLAADEQAQQRYLEQGERALKMAVERFPNFRQAHKNLANLLFKQGEQGEARTHFIRALELGDRDPITYGILSAIYYENELYSAAETAARNSIMLNPTIVEFRRILGLALYQQERFDEARAVFEELLQERPNDTFYWQMVSNTLINTDEVDEAARMLEIVRFMGRADPQTLLLLGDVYMNKNMVEDASQAYEDALAQQRQSGRSLPPVSTYTRPVETLNSFQAYELALGLLDAVEEAYGEDLDRQARNDVLALRSEINLNRGEEEEAARNLQQILENDPMNGRALLALAEYYGYQQPPEDASAVEERQFLARNLERARDLFGRAQELRYTGNERDREVARAAFVGEGQLLARQNQLGEALEALRQAQDIREEARIADYIQMIETVRSSRR